MTDSPTYTTTPKAGRDLPAAIGVGVGIFLAVAVGLLWATWFFMAVVALGLCLASIEIHRALLRKGMKAEVVPIAIGTAASVLGGYFFSRWDIGIVPIAWVVICLAATLLASLVARLFRGAEGFIRDVSASAFIIAYIPMLGVFMPLLMTPDDGRLRMLAVICCVIASDTGAFAVGVLTGRHKMAPAISPSKTWEGFGGGVAVSAIVGALMGVFLLGTSWWAGLALGILCSLAGTVGDLVESLIKRDAGIKDMSNFLPGHGGVMDRLDSMLVAVPVGWLVLYLALGG